jgi:hypothetical protein
LARIARAAGFSAKMASEGLTALKRHGVISRYRITYGPWPPYLTKILSPRRWVWAHGTPVLGPPPEMGMRRPVPEPQYREVCNCFSGSRPR